MKKKTLEVRLEDLTRHRIASRLLPELSGHHAVRFPWAYPIGSIGDKWADGHAEGSREMFFWLRGPANQDGTGKQDDDGRAVLVYRADIPPIIFDLLEGGRSEPLFNMGPAIGYRTEAAAHRALEAAFLKFCATVAADRMAGNG